MVLEGLYTRFGVRYRQNPDPLGIPVPNPPGGWGGGVQILAPFTKSQVSLAAVALWVTPFLGGILLMYSHGRN